MPAAPAVTVCEPLLATAPLQPSDAVQPVALALLTLQVRVTTWPTVVAVGVALMLTNLREAGAPIKGIENQSSGVIPVMKLLEDSFSYANQLGACTEGVMSVGSTQREECLQNRETRSSWFWHLLYALTTPPRFAWR